MAAGSTYTPIATTTLGSAQSTVTFSSIPSTYTDLILIGSQYTNSFNNYWFTVNGDTASNYSYTYLRGNGSTASSGRGSNSANIIFPTQADTTYDVIKLQLQNYANTSTYKTILYQEDNATGSGPQTMRGVGLWRNTAAITSITFTAQSTTMAIGSTFTLYGIQAA